MFDFPRVMSAAVLALGALTVVSMPVSAAESFAPTPENISCDFRTNPPSCALFSTVAVEHAPVDDGTLCTLLTGTACDIVIPEKRITWREYDPASFYAHP